MKRLKDLNLYDENLLNKFKLISSNDEEAINLYFNYISKNDCIIYMFDLFTISFEEFVRDIFSKNSQSALALISKVFNLCNKGLGFQIKISNHDENILLAIISEKKKVLLK